MRRGQRGQVVLVRNIGVSTQPRHKSACRRWQTQVQWRRDRDSPIDVPFPKFHFVTISGCG